MIDYAIEVVGGPYDGARPGMWRGDVEHPLPEAIFVGACAGDRSCGQSKCPYRKRHVAYWTPDEEGRPTRAVEYERQEEFVERHEGDELRGRGIYAIGGLMDPSNFGEAARELDRGGLPPLTVAGVERYVEAMGDAPLIPEELHADVEAWARRCELGLPDGRHETGWPA